MVWIIFDGYFDEILIPITNGFVNTNYTTMNKVPLLLSEMPFLAGS